MCGYKTKFLLSHGEIPTTWCFKLNQFNINHQVNITYWFCTYGCKNRILGKFSVDQQLFNLRIASVWSTWFTWIPPSKWESHLGFQSCNAITYFLTLGLYTLPKITMRIIPPRWFRPTLLAHGLIPRILLSLGWSEEPQFGHTIHLQWNLSTQNRHHPQLRLESEWRPNHMSSYITLVLASCAKCGNYCNGL